MIVAFIDDQRDEFGVEPICTTLQVAPSTYYAAKSRPLSARAARDAVMIPILVALWTANYRVYGAHKLWKAALRAGHVIGRDQVARLMRQAGIEGVCRKRRLRTTRPDPSAPRPADLVKRDFTAERPNQLWVTDLTYVPTWSGVAYVGFIVDVFSRMIGHSLARTRTAVLPNGVARLSNAPPRRVGSPSTACTRSSRARQSGSRRCITSGARSSVSSDG